MPITRTTSVAIAVCAAAFAVQAPLAARAAETQDSIVIVDTSHVRLATPGGQARLHARIAAAIRLVCDTADDQTLDEQADRQRCRSAARAGADAQMRAVLARAQMHGPTNAAQGGDELAARDLPGSLPLGLQH